MRLARLFSIITIIGCGGAMEPRVEPVRIESSESNATPTNTVDVGGGQLRVQYYGEPMTMSPIVTNDAWTNWITQHAVYESLLVSDPTRAPTYPLQGELAVALPEISDGGRVHTFRLRPNVRFHDGTPLTSEDVVATFDLIRDRRVRATHLQAHMGDLVHYYAPDQRTVVFEWARPVFMSLELYSYIPILPSERLVAPELFNDQGTNPLLSMPVGTGPWRFVEWERNARVRLRRNENYWGQVPYIENLHYIYVPESAVAVEMLHRGELDVLTRVASAEWSRVFPDDGRPYRIRYFVPNNYAWIGWNQQRPMFAQREVRQALRSSPTCGSTHAPG